MPTVTDKLVEYVNEHVKACNLSVSIKPAAYALHQNNQNYRTACERLWPCNYLYQKSIRTSSNSLAKNTLRIVELVLNLIKSFQYLLSKPPAKNAAELNFYYNIWYPIFMLLYPPGYHVRIKTGIYESSLDF